jgi:thiamine-monophosphate kinase
MSLDEIGERAIIRRIREIVGEPSERTLLGIGDDAAVIDAGGRLLVLTTDAFTEWVHFRFDLISPDQVGEKALAATVSDCAAMGCAPRWVTVALSAPSELSIERVEEIYHGLARGAKKYGCDLVGGDTVSSMSDMTLALTAVGEPFGGRVLARSGAEVGDDVYVTGALGGPMAGLFLLQNAPELTLREEFHDSVRRYLAPEARVEAARILATRFPVTSLIDVSDGLSVDIHHLARASGVGFLLERALIPAEPSALRIAEAFDESIDLLVLHGGEEFELLFTVSPGEEDLVEAVRAETGLSVTRIGTAVDREDGIVLLDECGEGEPLEEIGYEHFGKRAGRAGEENRASGDGEAGTRH